MAGMFGICGGAGRGPAATNPLTFSVVSRERVPNDID